MSWLGNNAATHYIRQARVNGGQWENETQHSEKDAQNKVVVNYDNAYDATFQYRVKSCDAQSCTAWVESNAVTVAAPESPDWVTATVYNGNDITISWSSADGAKAYVREARVNGGEWEGAVITDKLSVSRHNAKSDTYQYRVKACSNANGTHCSVQWTESSPLYLDYVPPAPSTLNATIYNGNDITVSWSASQGATRYIREGKLNDGAWGNLSYHTGLEANYQNVGSNTYTYRVKACSGPDNVKDCSPFWKESDPITVNFKPDALGEVRAVVHDGNTIRISWNIPMGADRFLREASTDGGTTWVNTEVLSEEDDNLEIKQNIAYRSYYNAAPSTYQYRVKACSGKGNSMNCSDSWTESNSVEIKAPVTLSFNPDNRQLSWTQSPNAQYYVLEKAMCTICGQVPAQDWQPVGGQLNQLTYTVSEQDFRKSAFRVKPCFGSNVCAAWSNVISTKPPLFSEKLAVNVDDAAFTDVFAPSADAVGTIAGEATAQGGSASYRIPMPLPPGRNGVQPSVSVNYSSRSGSGIAGVGFSLSAGSQISRCGATYAQDGLTQNPQYNDNDKLCLDGQRLIAASGVYGQDGTIYRTEQESLTRVTQSGALNSSYASFTVEYANGTVALFGIDTISRTKHQGRTASYNWLIRRQHDATGKNFIHYTYAEYGAGERLISQIYYTGNDASQVGHRRVKFNYEEKADKRSGYFAGGFYESTMRLAEIRTYTTHDDSSLVNTLSFNYAPSNATQRDLLRNVQLCGYNGSCLPATEFTWQDSAITVKNEYLSLNSTHSINSILPQGDRNGDGALDWPGKYINAEGQSTPNSHPQTNCTGVGASGNAVNCYTHNLDMNLDGYTDSLDRANDRLSIKLNSKSGVLRTIPTNIYPNRSAEIIYAGDLNGDTYPDIVIDENNSAVAAGDKITAYYHTKNVENPYTASNSRVLYTISKSDASEAFRRFASFVNAGDLDGNGLADFYITDERERDGSASKSQGVINKVYYTKPHSLQSTSVFTVRNFPRDDDDDYIDSGSPNEKEPDWSRFYTFADVNGDGLKDWLGWYRPKTNDDMLFVRYNTGGSFASPVATDIYTGKRAYYKYYKPVQDQKRASGSIYYVYGNAGSVRIGDIDNDGKDEILYPASMVAEACVYVREGAGSVQVCGSRVNGKLIENIDGEEVHNSISERYNHNIYVYRAIKQLENGSFTRIETGMHGAKTHTQLLDAQGDGLLDMVFNYGCSINGNGTPGCAFESAEPSGFREQRVNVSRNYGSGTGASGSYYAPIDILKAVENGVGHESRWEYRPLSSGMSSGIAGARDIYAKGTNYQKGYQNFASSMYVVTKFEQDDGVGNKREYQFAYRGAVYNTQGRGFMGFERIIERDVAAGTVTQSDFNQIYPKQGRIKRQAKFQESDYAIRGDGALAGAENESNALTYQESTWQEMGRHVYLQEQTTTHRDEQGAWLFTDTTLVESIDVCTNVTHQKSIREDEWGTYTSATKRTVSEDANCDYADSSPWWPNKLDDQTVAKLKVQRKKGEDPLSSADTSLDRTYKVTTAFSSYHANRKPQVLVVSSEIADSGAQSEEVGKGKRVNTVFNTYGLPTSITETAKVLNTSGSWVDSARLTSMTYTSDGYFPYSVTNAKGHMTRTETISATGQPSKQQVQVSSSQWLTTEYSYDDFNRPYSQKTDGSPTVYMATQSKGYDSLAPSRSVLKVVRRSAGTPEIREYKDKLGRTVRTISKAFNDSWIIQDVQYDGLGRKVFESMPYEQGKSVYGTYYSGFDVLGRPATRTVDQQCGPTHTGQMIVEYDYDGLNTNIDARETCYGIALGQMSRTYNSLEQLVKTRDALGGETHYSYNSQGLPVVIQDAAGNKIKARYNTMGRKITVLDENQGTTNFAYNGFGELQQETRGNGNTVKFYTDALGRVTRRTATGESDLAYSYDNSSKNGYGQMTSASGNGVSHEYSYDSFGRPVAHTVSGSGKSYTTTTMYDSNYGRVKGLLYPNNLTLEYIYDWRGYQTAVKNAANDYVYQTIDKLDVLGNIEESELGNGLVQQQYFSLASSQMKASYTVSDVGNLMALEYTRYDGFGNLKEMDVTTGAVGEQHRFSESYTYDDLHRLKQNAVNNIVTITYDYDAVGNLTKKSDFASTYDYSVRASGHTGGGANAVKRINKGGVWHGYSYDTRGNMTKGYGLTLAQYNAMDKPTLITKENVTSTFVYGPDHMRFKQTSEGRTTYYAGAYEEELEGEKITWRAYIGNIAVVSGTTGESDSIRYTHRDRLGSARLFTDENGKVIAERNFDPFGKPRESSGDLKLLGQLGDKDLTKTNRGFTDHEHLDEQQLIHMNGRVYDYNLGRFMSVDPLLMNFEDSQGINPYSYIRNNPLAGTDPTGYCEAETGTLIKSCVDVEVKDADTGESLGTKSMNSKHSNFAGNVASYVASKLGNGAQITGMSATMKNGQTVDLMSQSSQNIQQVGQSITNHGNESPDKENFDDLAGIGITGRRSAIPDYVDGKKEIVSVDNYEQTEIDPGADQASIVLPTNPKPTAGGNLPSVPMMRLPSMPIGPEIQFDWKKVDLTLGEYTTYDVTATTYSWTRYWSAFSPELKRTIKWEEQKFRTDFIRVPIDRGPLRQYKVGPKLGTNSLPLKVNMSPSISPNGY